MPKTRGNNKPNKTGRSQNSQGRFARLGHEIMSSAAYRSLQPNARALLLELVMLDNGRSNGALFLSEADAAARIGISDRKAVRRAFSALTDVGLIAMTKDAHFQVKVGQGRARCWRLTWLFDHANKQSASNDWRHSELLDSASRKRADAGLRSLKRYSKNQIPGVFSSHTPSLNVSRDAVAGVFSSPAKSENGANLPIAIGEDSPHYTAITKGGGERDPPETLSAFDGRIQRHLSRCPMGQKSPLTNQPKKGNLCRTIPTDSPPCSPSTA